MKQKPLFFTVLLAVSLIVSGCGPSAEQIATMTAAAWTATPTPTPSPTPTQEATPTPDMTPGYVRGRLLDTMQQPITGEIVGLYRCVHPETESQSGETKVYGIKTYVEITDGSYQQVEDTNIRVRTDSSGTFLLENVPPGEYILYALLGDMFFDPPSVFKDAIGTTIIFELLPGQTINLEVVVRDK